MLSKIAGPLSFSSSAALTRSARFAWTCRPFSQLINRRGVLRPAHDKGALALNPDEQAFLHQSNQRIFACNLTDAITFGQFLLRRDPVAFPRLADGDQPLDIFLNFCIAAEISMPITTFIIQIVYLVYYYNITSLL